MRPPLSVMRGRLALWRIRLWWRLRWIDKTHERLFSALAVVSMNDGAEHAFRARMALDDWSSHAKWEAVKRFAPNAAQGGGDHSGAEPSADGQAETNLGEQPR